MPRPFTAILAQDHTILIVAVLLAGVAKSAHLALLAAACGYGAYLV